MDNQILKAIQEMRKEVSDGFETVNKRLDGIEESLRRIEENEPRDIKAHLKQLQNVENKTELLNKRMFEVESRLNN
ncbi:hypothetical protein NSQ30_11005 [Bacillus sp. FSL R7-0651]|uniref:hypothetical protein n=1 Tax=Bacillus TaxID=1386 RepID=UPI001C2345DF|nr:hypothetical protein [Bacillus pumilus]